MFQIDNGEANTPELEAPAAKKNKKKKKKKKPAGEQQEEGSFRTSFKSLPSLPLIFISSTFDFKTLI